MRLSNITHLLSVSQVEILAECCKLVLQAAFSKVCTKPGICILQGLIFTKGFSGQITLGNNGLNTHEQLVIAGLFKDLTKESFFFLGLSLRSFGRWNTLWEMPGLEETAPLALESLASYLTSLNVNVSNLNLWTLLALVVVWRINEVYENIQLKTWHLILVQLVVVNII